MGGGWNSTLKQLRDSRQRNARKLRATISRASGRWSHHGNLIVEDDDGAIATVKFCPAWLAKPEAERRAALIRVLLQPDLTDPMELALLVHLTAKPCDDGR